MRKIVLLALLSPFLFFPFIQAAECEANILQVDEVRLVFNGERKIVFPIKCQGKRIRRENDIEGKNKNLRLI